MKELKVKHYEVEVDWAWGGTTPWGSTSRFKEISRFIIPGNVDFEERFEQEIKHLIEIRLRRYAFDCGDLSRPMHPMLYSVHISTVCATEYRPFDERWSKQVKEMIEEERARIEASREAVP